MEGLRKLLGCSVAGQELLAALEPHAGSSLPALITAVLQERADQSSSGEQPRPSLEAAATIVRGLTFLTPRCAFVHGRARQEGGEKRRWWARSLGVRRPLE